MPELDSRLMGWLNKLVADHGSDLHLKVGQPPILRVDGDIIRLEEPVLEDVSIKEVLRTILDERALARFHETHEADLSLAVDGLARFRTNVFYQRGHIGIVMRQIPISVQTIDDLGFPSIFKDIALSRHGLVLVTGPTGSGKSTTLAAMIDWINRNRDAHIITVEDPIEFLHNDIKCSITQRELGNDTESFSNALKHSLRQDPDVILVGEMRDIETMHMALAAAETGHLVLSTVHTTGAVKTIDRIVDAFPAQQQAQIRMLLAATLTAIVSQTLVQRVDGVGRDAAHEILINTPSVASTIREGKAHSLVSILQASMDLGMTTLENSLKNLYVKGSISYEEACAKCSDIKELEDMLQRDMMVRGGSRLTDG